MGLSAETNRAKAVHAETAICQRKANVAMTDCCGCWCSATIWGLFSL